MNLILDLDKEIPNAENLFKILSRSEWHSSGKFDIINIDGARAVMLEEAVRRINEFYGFKDTEVKCQKATTERS